jgi:hypothetical protein
MDASRPRQRMLLLDYPRCAAVTDIFGGGMR